MTEYIDCVCTQCGEVKEVCCFVDGEPWCEECFDKAMDGGADNGA